MMNTAAENTPLSAIPTAELVDRYCEVDAIDEWSKECFNILHELERRVPKAINRWFHSDEFADCDSPSVLRIIFEKYGEE